MSEETNRLFSKIADRITHDYYFYLILATNNSFTSGLYLLTDGSVHYSNETVGVFKEFICEIKACLKRTGVTLIYKTELNNFQVKSIPKYNPELFNSDLFELIIFQEFGFKPIEEERLLILNESIKKEKIKETLVYACYVNDTDKILARLENVKKTQLNKKLEYTGTPLGLCTQNNNLKGFCAIAEKGANINKKSLGISSLQLAFKYSIEIAKYIFNQHRDAFDKEFLKQGFYLAADCEDRQILELLKSIGGDLNTYDKSFPHIHNFTDRNNLTGIQFCLDNGIDINLKDKQNRTALGKAIMRGYPESIEFLRKQGGKE